MPKYDWFEIIRDNDLQQGDILENVDIYLALPDEEQSDNVKSVVETHDVIVLTQSCDITKEVCRNILVCPIWTLSDARQEVSHFRTSRGLEDLRNGRVVGYHILNRCDKTDFRRDFRIITFYRVFELPKNRAIAIASAQSKRLRLLPPYREHLSQAFARFFMRVGLPADIPKFE
ncbi:MAG: hypothetical protein JXA46_09280 [Dehalococcoidales bacterium]|nr:hypothetical protein [Dehalococcoidales bacterium]